MAKKTRTNAKTLDTMAKDNFGHRYLVHLIPPTPDKPFQMGHVVHIEGTPGRWELGSFAKWGEDDREVSIDWGQKWVCTNWNEVLREARQVVARQAKL